MIQGSVIYAFYMSNIFALDLKNCEFVRLKQDQNVIYITSDNIVKVLKNFQSLNFEEISSKNGFIKNNVLLSNGIFIKVNNFEFVEFKESEFLNNSIMNHFIEINAFINISNVYVQGINNRIYDANKQTKLFATFFNMTYFQNLSSFFFR